MKPTLKLCTSHSFDRDLKDAGLVTSLEPVPLHSMGDHSGEFDRRCKTKHTQREGLYVLRRSELGLEESVNNRRLSGRIKEIRQDQEALKQLIFLSLRGMIQC